MTNRVCCGRGLFAALCRAFVSIDPVISTELAVSPSL